MGEKVKAGTDKGECVGINWVDETLLIEKKDGTRKWVPASSIK